MNRNLVKDYYKNAREIKEIGNKGMVRKEKGKKGRKCG